MCQLCEEYEAEIRRLAVSSAVERGRELGKEFIPSSHEERGVSEVPMGVIEKIVVSDEAMRRLEIDARLNGRTPEQEVASRLEQPGPSEPPADLLSRSRALRASLPKQTTDSLELLREDRWR
jgi:hypothetical protein